MEEFLGEPLGALGKVVVMAMLVERMLAYVFEHDWFERLVRGPASAAQLAAGVLPPARMKGLKATIALALSYLLCEYYNLDVFEAIFGAPAGANKPDWVGIVATAFVVAGGSAGAIALFQGYFGFAKETRDAKVAASTRLAQEIAVTASAPAVDAVATPPLSPPAPIYPLTGRTPAVPVSGAGGTVA